MKLIAYVLKGYNLPTKAARQVALENQVRRLTGRIEQLEQISTQLSNWRTVIAVVGVLTVSVLLTIPSLRLTALIVFIVFAVVFTVVVRRHRVILKHIREHEILRQIKSAHIARMTLDWLHIPKPSFKINFFHPVEVDLDLANLHRLLNTANSLGGSERVREWLLPLNPNLNDIQMRQQRVAELIRQPIFRDKLLLKATAHEDDLYASGEGRSLLNWLRSESNGGNALQTLRILSVLVVSNAVLAVLTAFRVVPDFLLLISLTAYAFVFVSRFRTIQTIFEDALTIEGALRRIQAVMEYLETSSYRSMPQVSEVVAPIVNQKPSRTLRRATLVISGASVRANPIFWLLINMLVPWDYYFAHRLQQLKADLNKNLPVWLDIWHELEALSSLANFGYLNPDYVLPQVGGDCENIFDTVEIGHPLISDDERVCNDFEFHNVSDMVIITGSNMSGKSSFLRTLGVNLCLAYAGAPVCAGRLDTIIFRLYTSIRMTDSLDDGISFFYAEVRRLKGLLDAINETDEPPLFFMIDEIFRGTNNRERLVGSRSYIRALVEKNGVGLIATHDLELVALADEHPNIRNFHFREDVQGERMVFDYVLREGPSPTTNALRIMAMAGLPVEVESE